MSEEVKVPAMGESITEAIVSQIFKDSGSFVEAEEELLELETDKVNQVLYAQVSGTVQYLVEREEAVAIGQVVATIEPQKREKEERKRGERLEENKQEEASLSNVRVGVEGFVQEVQETKREEKDASQLLEPANTQKLEVPASFSKRKEVRKKMSSIRKVIAKRLVEAKQSTAMLTSFNEVDMGLVGSIRKQHQEEFQKKNAVKLGLMSFFVKACVSALKKFPEVNGYIDEDDIVYRHYFDIGIAVGTERGLVVPVVRDCDKLTFAEIEKEIASLAQKARTGKLSADELKGAGFTITNGGVYGSLFSTPIINPPQSAILGMHAIKDRPVAVEGRIEIRPMMYLALSYDHRLVDGKEAVSFLVHIKKALEEPGYLLLDG